MLPNYKMLKDELNNLKECITAIRISLDEKLKDSKLSEEAKQKYDALIARFERIDNAIDGISGKNADKSKADENWDILKEELVHKAVISRNASLAPDAVNENTEKFNKDDNYREIWNAECKLGRFGNFVYEMEAYAKIQAANKEIDDFAEKRDAFEKKVANAYNEPIKYKNQHEMLLEKDSFSAEMKANKDLYDAFMNRTYINSNDYIAHTDPPKNADSEPYATHKALVDNAAEISKITADIEKIDKDLNLIGELRENSKNTISSYYETIKETEKSYDDALSELNNRKENRINDIKTIDSENEAKNEELNKKIDELASECEKEKQINQSKENKLNELISSIKEEAKDTGKDKPEIRFSKSIKSDFVDIMLQRDELLVLDGDIQYAYLENRNILGSGEDISLKKFVNTFKDIYHPSAAMSASIDEVVTSPAELRRLIKKCIEDKENGLDKQAEDLLDIDPKDKALRKVGNANEFVDSIKKELNDLREMFNDKNEYREMQIRRNNDLLNYKNQIEANNKDAKLKKGIDSDILDDIEMQLGKKNTEKETKLAGMKKELEAKQQEAKQQETKQQEALNKKDELKKKQNELAEKQSKLAAKLQKIYARGAAGYEADKSKYDAIDTKIKAYSIVASEYDKLCDQKKSTADGLGIFEKGDVKDLFKNARDEIKGVITGFYNVKDYGKKKNHPDSDEYKKMIEAVEKIKDADEKLDIESFKKLLTDAKDAASTYVDLKNKEWSRFNPFPSTQRKARLDFADALRVYADDAVGRIQKQQDAIKDLNKNIKTKGFHESYNEKGNDAAVIGLVNGLAIKPQNAAKGGFVNEQPSIANELNK